MNSIDNNYSVDIVLDVTGLNCPMPLLKTKLALNGMESQQILKVVATDPGSERDFHMFVSQSDHQILNFQKNEASYFYWIKKA